MACLCSSSSKTQPCVNMTHLFVTFVVTLCSLLSSHSAAGAQVALLALPGSSVTAALPVLQTPVVLHGSGPGFTRGTPTSSAAALLQHFRTATKVSISSHVLLVQGTCVFETRVTLHGARHGANHPAVLLCPCSPSLRQMDLCLALETAHRAKLATPQHATTWLWEHLTSVLCLCHCRVCHNPSHLTNCSWRSTSTTTMSLTYCMQLYQASLMPPWSLQGLGTP